MGSWTYSAEQIDLHPFTNFIKMENYATSPVVFTEDSFKGEVLKSKKYDCCPEDYLSLEYVFKVKVDSALFEFKNLYKISKFCIPPPATANIKFCCP